MCLYVAVVLYMKSVFVSEKIAGHCQIQCSLPPLSRFKVSQNEPLTGKPRDPAVHYTNDT